MLDTNTIFQKLKKVTPVIWYVAIVLYAIFLFYIHFIRIFDQNFWGDEAFTINAIKAGFFEMIAITAGDVHPPLYYIIIYLFAELFGYTGIVYHVVTLIPYTLILLLGITVVYKWFGKETSMIFLSFCAFLTSSIRMAAEVRMYTWAALFVLISFLALYKILKENHKQSWIIFVLASLAAAYTHYYCLVSVAFFYIVLILDALTRRRENLKRTIITCVATVIGYFPWLVTLLQTFERTIGNFWQTGTVGPEPFILYIFESQYTEYFYKIFLVAFGVWTIFELGLIKIENKKVMFFDHTNFELTDRFIWGLTGLFSLYGTIAIGIFVSNTIRPMFIPRYIFPIAIVIWLLLGVFISKFRLKMIYAILITGMILHCGYPEYQNTYMNEKTSNETHMKTFTMLNEQMEEEDVIVTNDYFLDWTVAETYFPEHPCEPLVTFFDYAKEDTTYWFLLTAQMEASMTEELAKRGYIVESVEENGILGTYPITIFCVQANNH